MTGLSDEVRALSQVQHSIAEAHTLVKDVVTVSTPTNEQLERLADLLQAAFVKACQVLADRSRPRPVDR